MDLSIKTAFVGVGYLINGAGHFIKMRGKKFNAKPGKQNKYQKDLQGKTDAEKADVQFEMNGITNYKELFLYASKEKIDYKSYEEWKEQQNI